MTLYQTKAIMKKVLTIFALTLALACSKDGGDDNNNTGGNNGGGNNNADCGTFNGYTLYKDSEGCYYNGGNYDSKIYVEASNCTCE